MSRVDPLPPSPASCPPAGPECARDYHQHRAVLAFLAVPARPGQDLQTPARLMGPRWPPPPRKELTHCWTNEGSPNPCQSAPVWTGPSHQAPGAKGCPLLAGQGPKEGTSYLCGSLSLASLPPLVLR